MPYMSARPTITPLQCRLARFALRWSQRRLAKEADVAPATVAEFELENRNLAPRTARDIIATLTSAGIDLLPETATREATIAKRKAP